MLEDFGQAFHEGIGTHQQVGQCLGRIPARLGQERLGLFGVVRAWLHVGIQRPVRPHDGCSRRLPQTKVHRLADGFLIQREVKRLAHSFVLEVRVALVVPVPNHAKARYAEELDVRHFLNPIHLLAGHRGDIQLAALELRNPRWRVDLLCKHVSHLRLLPDRIAPPVVPARHLDVLV